MPFTLAHPALVLPLASFKNRFSLTALIAGSIAPDFEFFFQMREVENIGHHWYGILLFDMPAALVFCCLFHGLMKTPLIANLPAYYSNRLVFAQPFNWMAFAASHKAVVFVSLLTGVLSHLLWDGFTHADGFVVRLWPWLSTAIQIGSYQTPLYFLLQAGFSVLGMYLVYRAITRLPEKTVNAGHLQKNSYYWPLLLSLFSLILLVRIAGWPQYNSFWSVVMAVMGSLSYAWMLGSFFIQTKWCRTAPTAGTAIPKPEIK